MLMCSSFLHHAVTSSSSSRTRRCVISRIIVSSLHTKVSEVTQSHVCVCQKGYDDCGARRGGVGWQQQRCQSGLWDPSLKVVGNARKCRPAWCSRFRYYSPFVCMFVCLFSIWFALQPTLIWRDLIILSPVVGDTFSLIILSPCGRHLFSNYFVPCGWATPFL